MQKKFMFVTEEESEAVVEYRVTESAGGDRSYGIAAVKSEGETVESEEVCNIFFTYEEAERVTDMLCRCGVTPCVLRDVIRDLL